MAKNFDSELPHDDDVVIWLLPERNDMDMYRVTKGSMVIGEFTGRSVSSVVFKAAVEHSEPGRAIWLNGEGRFRRLEPMRSEEILPDDIK